MNKIVIVGAGHAGVQLAAGLRSNGFDGTVTLISDELELPYHRPPLSKAYMIEGAGGLMALRPQSFYAQNDIDLRLGTIATAIDRAGHRLTLANGGSVTYDRLVLATGARARIPQIAGITLDGVRFLRTAQDAASIRQGLVAGRNIVIVGGGFIGLELAATAAALGCRVAIVEALPRLLARSVSPQVSSHFHALHRRWDNDIMLGCAVDSFIGEAGRLTAVTTTTGGVLPADMAIVGVGATPNDELAAAAGLAADGGVLVDEHLHTGDPSVAAIGDVARFRTGADGPLVRIESVQNAVDQGKLLARALVGEEMPYRAVPWFWSDQADTKLQIVGRLPANTQQAILRGRPEDNAFSTFHFHEGRLVAVESINRGQDHVAGRKLLDAGRGISPAQAGDPDFDLKAFASTPI